MSQQEDDLRALAKIMDFLRAVSIILVVAHLYWYCYEAIKLWGLNIGVVDRILMNFHRTAGLFGNMLYTKLFALVLMGLSCLGTKGVKEEHITWSKIWAFMGAGFVFFFLNWWILALPLPIEANAALYTFTITVGYVCLLMAGLYMSRLLKNNLMEDVFNQENESFMQETRLLENEYSVNLPTRFYYRKKWNRGWINVVNPFRAVSVLGTPGSGKSYAIINNFIKQQIEKGFAIYCYDFKYPDLSTIVYNHLLHHSEGYKVKPKFYVINFDDPRRSHRCNPIHPRFHERHIGCLRIGLYDYAQPEQDVGAEAGRFLRGVANRTLCRYHLVSPHFRGREILYLSARHRVSLPQVRGYFSDTHLIS